MNLKDLKEGDLLIYSQYDYLYVVRYLNQSRHNEDVFRGEVFHYYRFPKSEGKKAVFTSANIRRVIKQ